MHSKSFGFTAGGELDVLVRMSVERLWTGVDVWKALFVCRFRPWLLFGVHGGLPWLTVSLPLPGRVFDAAAAGVETPVGACMGSLFLDLRGPPERASVVIFLFEFY